MDNSFLQYIPLIKRGGSLFWPNGVVNALKALSRGPETSLVNSGESLCDFIFDARQEIGIKDNLRRNAFKGYCLFFDDLTTREESRSWFSEVVPFLARLLIRFPEILESHYKKNEATKDCDTSLRILHPQQPGIIFLSQELVAALLACAFFSLFPTSHRWKKHLPPINFDSLFAALVMSSQNQEQKIRCIANYFQHVSSGIPTGVVSFERKVLPRKGGYFPFSYPCDASWSDSKVSLCKFEVLEKGRIEDHDREVIEVDFANEYLGGGALSSGCVQEEIRFMINPELIAGMLFLPRMEDNESIEIVGAEQFSRYEGYASGFKFAGNFVDTRPEDNYGRRHVRILAIDALCFPGEKQYRFGMIRREVNKAYCGFLDHAQFRNYSKSFNVSCSIENHVEALHSRDEFEGTNQELCECNSNTSLKQDEEITNGSDSVDIAKLMSTPDGINGSSSKDVKERSTSLSTHCHTLGISTGNWGCGAFGGDVELKSILQWIAASQASRPFLIYHTFGESFGERLLKITEWIKSHDWTVGELWDTLIEYSKQRVEGKTRHQFFDWLLPCVNGASTKGYAPSCYYCHCHHHNCHHCHFHSHRHCHHCHFHSHCYTVSTSTSQCLELFSSYCNCYGSCCSPSSQGQSIMASSTPMQSLQDPLALLTQHMAQLSQNMMRMSEMRVKTMEDMVADRYLANMRFDRIEQHLNLAPFVQPVQPQLQPQIYPGQGSQAAEPSGGAHSHSDMQTVAAYTPQQTEVIPESIEDTAAPHTAES